MGALPNAPPVPPSQVGVYRLEELIGAGGMGSVYRARRNDGLFDQTVAIKFIRQLDGVAEALIDAERKLLARMEHPGIARIIDGGSTANGLHFLVMEFVSGVALDHYATEHGLDVRARVVLMREVCAGVAHAHQHLVVHCDIKPANILVTDEGHPKLIDFGVARIQDVTDARPEGFTRAYTSPQRLAGAPAVVTDDVYSLGVTLCELLAGKPQGDLAAIGRKATAAATRRALRKRRRARRRPAPLARMPPGGCRGGWLAVSHAQDGCAASLASGCSVVRRPGLDGCAWP